MAITLTKVDEEALKNEFKQNGFETLKHYVEDIVINRDNYFKYKELREKVDEDLKALELKKAELKALQSYEAQLTFAVNKAVKAGVNRKSLEKELNSIHNQIINQNSPIF